MITKSMIIGYGIDEVVNVISKELSESGYEIEVLTTENEFRPKSYEIKVLPMLKFPLLGNYWQKHALTDFRIVFSAKGLFKEYDVILTFDPMHAVGAFAKIFFQKPVIMYYFGVVPPNVLDSFERKIESLRQILLWNSSFVLADYLVTNSYYTRSLLPSFLRRKAMVNYHGVSHLIVDDLKYSRRFKEELDVEDKILILSVGRFSTPYKNMWEVAKIFLELRKSYQEIALVLIGRGTEEHVKLFSKFKDVHVLVNVPYRVLKMAFAACDIYCTTSLWEGFDLPLAAAQANGKPVVAYDVGAHSEVVLNKETGFLANSPREFKYYLELLLRDETLRREMGRSASQFVKKFDWSTSVRRLEKLIHEISESRC